MKKILIAGASGFIGTALIEKLLENPDVHIVALSRSQRTSHHSRLEWKKCDLFSLKDIADAMVGCVEAFYLVHSMLPSASLSQGTFYDFDLIMADNFVRASQKEKVQHIVYLGGLIPEDGELSWHLRSRLEVETVILDSGIPSTVFRAGLIIGPGGSSFTILKRLVERLPVMICPKWTNSRSQPIALQDVIKVLLRASLDESVKDGIYDLKGPETVTYQELIRRTSEKVKKKSHILSFNLIPISLSRWWVTLITGMPKNLIYPLVLSLRHEMIASENHRWPYPEDLSTTLNESLDIALKNSAIKREFAGYIPSEKDVRSVQRLVLPSQRDAAWVAQEYFEWLPTFFSTLIRVQVEGDICTFYLVDPAIKILILKKSAERSTSDRQLLYVIGGLLSGHQDRGRLEFREILQKRYVMAALHEFRPALPWYIYKWTQAIFHIFVMRSFGEHLKWFVISEKGKI
jgi:uncharacterized protein YbjT (DUF2867 family)